MLQPSSGFKCACCRASHQTGCGGDLRVVVVSAVLFEHALNFRFDITQVHMVPQLE